MKSKFLLTLSISLMATLLSCSDSGDEKKETTGPKRVDCGAPSSCVPADGALVEVTCPTGSEDIQVGDTLAVRWRSLVTDFTGYRIQASTTGGAEYTELSTESILPTGSDDNQCLSFDVVIPSDGSLSGDVIFQIRDYNSSAADMRDASESVAIPAP